MGRVQKTSHPVRVDENIYIDSQGEFKCEILFKLLNIEYLTRQPENRFFKGYRPDFKIGFFYDCDKDFNKKFDRALVDYKKVFTEKDYLNFVDLNEIEFPNNNSESPKKIFYPNDFFVDYLKDGFCRNIWMQKHGFAGIKQRFEWLFKKCFELSTKPIKCVDCDKVFYPYNFDVLGGSPRGSVFPCTDGVHFYLLNWELYCQGYYDLMIPAFFIPTCAAYFNVARIQFDDFSSGKWKDERFNEIKEYYYPKSELLPFKMHDDKGNFHPLQKKEFDLVTTQNIINILTEVIQTKERLENGANKEI